jgi:hypothetical protein
MWVSVGARADPDPGIWSSYDWARGGLQALPFPRVIGGRRVGEKTVIERCYGAGQIGVTISDLYGGL